MPSFLLSGISQEILTSETDTFYFYAYRIFRADWWKSNLDLEPKITGIIMSQEMDENNCSVVAYPAVKFTIKKEFDKSEELEVRPLFKVWMVFSEIYKLIFISRQKNKKEKMKERTIVHPKVQ